MREVTTFLRPDRLYVHFTMSESSEDPLLELLFESDDESQALDFLLLRFFLPFL